MNPHLRVFRGYELALQFAGMWPSVLESRTEGFQFNQESGYMDWYKIAKMSIDGALRTLGLGNDFSIDQLNDAKRDLLSRNHPDRFPNPDQKAEASERSKNIGEAFLTLKEYMKVRGGGFQQAYSPEPSGPPSSPAVRFDREGIIRITLPASDHLRHRSKEVKFYIFYNEYANRHELQFEQGAIDLITGRQYGVFDYYIILGNDIDLIEDIYDTVNGKPYENVYEAYKHIEEMT